MNYLRIYDQIVDRARGRQLDCYREKHHVTPKCLGGTNNKSNLVELTAREHFICHWLLHRIHPENAKLALAFKMISTMKSKIQSRYIPSSRAIAEARQAASQAVSSIKAGKKHSENTLEKMRRPRTEEGKSNMKGERGPQKNPSGSRGPQKNPRQKGYLLSEEHRANLKGPRGSQELKKCPHCSREGGNAMLRWHFDNCKLIKKVA